MNILLVHNLYRQVGGEDLCVKAESALLRSRGHNVTEYLVDNSAITDSSTLSVAGGSIWNAVAYGRVRELCRTYRPEVVHFHNTVPLISPAAYYAAKAESCAVVQTLHNYRIVCPNALLFRNGEICESCLERTFAWPGILRKCYRDSAGASATIALMSAFHRMIGTWENAIDSYIALTDFQKAKLIRAGLPAAKIAVKPNFSEQSGFARGEGGFAFFAGRLSPEKGVNVLLEAWRNIDQNVELRIAGEGPLTELVKDAAAQDKRIQFLGHLAGEQIARLAGESFAMIVPSLCYDNFPRVLVEAFSHGTPVICSRIGAMPEIVDHGVNGLHFRPGDPQDLAAQVEALFRQPGMQTEMRKAAFSKFTSRYSPESNYSQLINIYESAQSATSRQAFAPAT